MGFYWDATLCRWAGGSRRLEGFLSSVSLRLRQSERNGPLDLSKHRETLAERRSVASEL
jgi:hypothetical protein